MGNLCHVCRARGQPFFSGRLEQLRRDMLIKWKSWFPRHWAQDDPRRTAMHFPQETNVTKGGSHPQ